MFLQYSQQPTGVDIVSLVDMKEFLRVDSDDENDTITALISAAVQSIQDYTGRHFVDTTYDATVNNFNEAIFPTQITTVSNVVYRDINGDTQTLDTSKYFVDGWGIPARIKFKDTPSLHPDKFNRVAIQGTVVNSIEAPLIHAVKMLAAHYFENRRAAVVGATTSIMPFGIRAIINPYRIIYLK